MTDLVASPLITEESIKSVVDSFYIKIRSDPLLSPIFEQAIGTEASDWAPHMEIMYAFWSSLMLGTKRYGGNPFKKHKDLPPFDKKLFDHWLELFEETVRQWHTPEIAELYKMKSQMIARSLKFGLYENDSN